MFNFYVSVSSVTRASPSGCCLFGTLSTRHSLHKFSRSMLLYLIASSPAPGEIGGVASTGVRSAACPSWGRWYSHFRSPFYRRHWVMGHPKGLGRGWGGLGLLLTFRYLCHTCVHKAPMEGSKSFLMLPSVILQKYKLGHCLLEDLQRLPNACDR